MPKISDIYSSNANFLRCEDLQKKRVSVTIEDVTVEKIGDDKKLVLSFEGKEKKLALNKTNARMLEDLTGSDDSESWIGYRITLRPDMTDYQGKRVPCIRIDSELPTQPERQRRPVQAHRPAQEEYEDTSEIPF